MHIINHLSGELVPARPPQIEEAARELLPNHLLVVKPWNPHSDSASFEVFDFAEPYRRYDWERLGVETAERAARELPDEADDREDWSPQSRVTQLALRCVRFVTRPLERRHRVG